MLSYPVRIALIAALGGFLFGFETAVISGAEKTIQQVWSLSPFWQGFTVASSLIGTVIGSMIAGFPAQKYGRKKVLMFIAILYLLSAIGCALTSVWILFVTFRFIGGLAVGASPGIFADIDKQEIGEISDKNPGNYIQLKRTCKPAAQFCWRNF